MNTIPYWYVNISQTLEIDSLLLSMSAIQNCKTKFRQIM